MMSFSIEIEFVENKIILFCAINELSEIGLTNIIFTTVGKIIFVKPISDSSLIAQNNIILFSTNSISIENDIIRLVHDVTDTKNQTILLLLFPLSDYILY